MTLKLAVFIGSGCDPYLNRHTLILRIHVGSLWHSLILAIHVEMFLALNAGVAISV